MVVVATMQGTYGGHDGCVESWNIDNLEIDVVENPSVHRPWLKKNNLADGVTTDVLYRVAERLGGPQGGHFGRFCPKTVEVGEDDNLIVGKLKMASSVRQNVTGILD